MYPNIGANRVLILGGLLSQVQRTLRVMSRSGYLRDSFPK